MTLVSCEKPLELDLQASEALPVVYVSLKNSGISVARLSYSASIKGEFKTDRSIQDADIRLYEEGTYVDSFDDEGGGDYSLNYDFDISKSYKIKVNTPFGEVESEAVYFYPAPQINDVSLSVLTQSNPPHLNDSYILSIDFFVDEHIPYYSFFIAGVSEGVLRYDVNESIVQSGEIAGPCSPSFIITNECFKNQNIILDVKINQFYGTSINNPEGIYDGFKLEMVSLSESAYEAALYNFSYDFVDLFFAEPSPPYSNIKGGYGVVEALNYTRVDVLVDN